MWRFNTRLGPRFHFGTCCMRKISHVVSCTGSSWKETKTNDTGKVVRICMKHIESTVAIVPKRKTRISNRSPPIGDMHQQRYQQQQHQNYILIQRTMHAWKQATASKKVNIQALMCIWFTLWMKEEDHGWICETSRRYSPLWIITCVLFCCCMRICVREKTFHR